MGSVSLTGALLGSPGSSGFPASIFNAPISLATGAKLFTNATGVLSRQVTSPGAFIPLSSVGANADVPKADTLYARTDAEMTLRVTQDDGSGGSTVVLIPISGLFIMETPNTKQITLLEVMGTGKLEYFASGP